MLELAVEWLDAPGVADPVDAATWARLEIRARGLDGVELVPTRLVHEPTGRSRTGVYGSVFGLARWVADHYWALLWEGPRQPGWRAGRDLARQPRMRPWVQRHCMLVAREGYALPDLILARDGEHVVLAVRPDPATDGRPVRFQEDGVLRLPVEEVEAALGAFLEAVLEELRGVEALDAKRLREDWAAVLGADAEERVLCQRAARMGLDPYDQEELDDRLADLLVGPLQAWPEPLVGDMLDALDGSQLPTAFRELGELWRTVSALSAPAEIPEIRAFSAHELGYERARACRRELGLDGADRDPLVRAGEVWGLDLDRERAADLGGGRRLDGLVGGEVGVPVLVGGARGEEARRFRWARALHLWRFGLLARGPRLLTRSHPWTQREGRAFAAELLAPAAALREELDDVNVTVDQVLDLARKHGVSPTLIQHQVENHGLGFVVE